MSLLTEQRILLAKAEATPGTAESLTAAEGAFNIYAMSPDDPIITFEDDFTQRDGQSSFDPLPGVPGARAGRAKFWTDLVGKGASGQPDWATVFLPACGYQNASGTFTGVTGYQVPITIATQEDGTVRTLAGCVGTWTMQFTHGRASRIEFEFLGIEVADADVSIVTPTYPTVLPPRWANASGATYDSVSLITDAMTIAANNEFKLRETPNTVTGYVAGIITRRVATWTAAPETVVVATKNWQTFYQAGTTGSLVNVLGTAANNIITTTLPAAQLTSRPQRGSRGGVMTTILSGQACRNSSAGDNSVSVVFS